MCGRASLTKIEKELQERFLASFDPDELEQHNPLPNYNIAPTHMHPVITGLDPERIRLFRWGLIPFWAKRISIGSKLINARIESVIKKPAFRQAIQQRRCIVPFDGFYEWHKSPYGKIPHYITVKNTPIFSVAGLWEKWKSPVGKSIYSFTLITMPANDFMSKLHTRMPAILLPDQEREWINPDYTGEEALQFLTPIPDEMLDSYTISDKVNKVENNDPSILQHKVYLHLPRQGNLFD